MMNSRSTLIAMTALMGAGMAGLSAPATAFEGPGLSVTTMQRIAKQATKPQKAERSSMRAMLGGGVGSSYTSQRRAGPGWSNRHVQRMAAKKRHVARNRAAHKGGR